MIKIHFVALILLAAHLAIFAASASAQLGGRSGGFLTPGSETSGGYVIPDVNNKLSLASLLYNRTVAEGLGIDVEGRKLINDFLAANGGSFAIKVITYPNNIPKTDEEEQAERDAHLANSQALLDELLSPGQWDRLRQMAYQVEVGRMGLASALTGGRLGDDSGVHGQQTDAIHRKAGQEDAKAKAEIVRILTRMQDEVIAELTPEQQKRAKQLLGEPIVLKEDLLSSMREPGSVEPGAEAAGGYAIPDVNNKLSLALLLYNRSITKSLGLSDEGKRLIHEYLAQNNRSFQRKTIVQSQNNRKTAEQIEAEMEAFRTQSAGFLDELVSPGQWARLRQLAYQVEVSRIGLARAFTVGKLAADLGVEEQQMELIHTKAGAAEARAKAAIVQVLARMQDEVLAVLTPSQRKKAKQLLGDPIVFKEEVGASSRFLPGFEEPEVKGE